MNRKFLKLFVGDRTFYKRVLALMIPIMIQNGITNFVNMLDNVMIGRIGTPQMTGVAISNELFAVFNVCVFGAVSGASIFGAQYYGKGDYEGLKFTFRFKVLLCAGLTALTIGLLFFKGEQLVSLYLTGEGNANEVLSSLGFAKDYMIIMCAGLLPYALSQCYCGTLRETEQAIVPMIGGILAVFVNLCLNYILIFGNMGAPAMGVRGAAIATVIARFVELFVVALWTHLHGERNKFIVGVYRSLYIPRKLVGQIAVKGFPLLVNEAMWAIGIAMVNQCYSTLGYDVVSANNISQTFFNVFGVAFMAVGASIAIILGQMLGAGKLEEAKKSSRKLIAFSVFVSIVVSSIYYVCAGMIPQFYNCTDSVRSLATLLMRIAAVTMPLEAMAHASYFSLRSGGKIFITLLFDSGFVWAVTLPAAFLLCQYMPSILWVYGISKGLNILKCIMGGILVEKGIWIKNIVSE